MEALVLVGVGGAVGAVGRYLVGVLLDSYPNPYATLAVNVVGSFLLGLVAFSAADDRLVLLLGTGVCGAFTTFSSFGFQTVDRWSRGRPGQALANALGNLALAAAAVGLAWLLA